jgi:hypothetical protein
VRARAKQEYGNMVCNFWIKPDNVMQWHDAMRRCDDAMQQCDETMRCDDDAMSCEDDAMRRCEDVMQCDYAMRHGLFCPVNGGRYRLWSRPQIDSKSIQITLWLLTCKNTRIHCSCI